MPTSARSRNELASLKRWRVIHACESIVGAAWLVEMQSLVGGRNC